MAAALYDLTTIAAVEAYVGLGSPQSSAISSRLQQMISSASRYWLNRCGFFLGSNGTGPFAGVDSYIESYDGNGGIRLFLRQCPIVSVTSLQIMGRPLVQSTSWNQAGFVIDSEAGFPYGTGPSISLRAGGGGLAYATLNAWPGSLYGSFGYTGLPQCIQISYTAGWSEIPDDIFDKCTQMVAVNWKRQNRIDNASESVNGIETTSFRSWIVPPEVEAVIRNYTRVAVV